MSAVENAGKKVRAAALEVVCMYMESKPECQPNGEGLRAASIFRECGLDWGDQPGATSTSQQYWLVAALRSLEADGRVKRDSVSKRWRLA